MNVRPKILFVDDEVDLLELYEYFLEELPIDYKFAYDGSEAIEILKNEKFDFIFSDIRMPFKSGIEFLEYINNHNLKPRHFCFITAYREITKEAIMEKGADNIIYKPIGREILVDYITKLIENF